MLKEWFLVSKHDVLGEKRYALAGLIYGSSVLEDGEFISTPTIQKAIEDKEKECIVFLSGNSQYICYWKDCAFEKGDTARYLEAFYDYREKYVDRKLWQLQDNSILILLSGDSPNYFKHAFYKRHDELRRIEAMDDIKRGYKIISPAQTEEEKEVVIDLRYCIRGENELKMFYADIPEDMELYVENQGNAPLHVVCGLESYTIEEKERVAICVRDTADYMEFLKDCVNSTQLPRKKELFSKEKVFQEMMEDAHNGVKKKYMIILEGDDMKELHSKDDKIVVCASGGIACALLLGEYTLAKKLAEAGSEVRVEETIKIVIYDDKKGNIQYSLNTQLMECLADDKEMPDDVYEILWGKAKTTNAQMFKGMLTLKIRSMVGCNSEIMLYNVKRLQKEWEEAADELLRAWMKYYFNTYAANEYRIWAKVFEAFPDKHQLILEELLAKYFSVKGIYGMVYPSDEGRVRFCAYWKLFQHILGEVARKKYAVFMIHFMLKRVFSISEEMEWFWVLVLADIKDFEDEEVEKRNECVQM